MFCTVNLYFLILENYWNFTFSEMLFHHSSRSPGTTFNVKRAFQNHRKYICSLTSRSCHSRVFLFLTKLFWNYSGPNHVLDIPTEDVTMISILTHFRNVKKNALPFLLQSHCALKLDKRPGSTKLLCKKM